MASPDEFDRAAKRSKDRRAEHVAAKSARYDARLGKIVVSLVSGVDVSFPPSIAQGLEHAKPADLKTIEITPSGFGLHIPKLDADLYVPALMEGLFGSRKWAAARLGSAGGKAKSNAKTHAARKNGKLGGRPRKAASTS